jgi:parallel beta-helix repeat protein
MSGIIGIDLERCLNTIVSGNNITENSHNGITLYPGALNNVLYGNYIASSYRGIILWEASNNSIYRNSFINNTDQVYVIESGYNNSWDNGYPSGGNFWSDYDEGDFYSGPYQNVSGSDGIGDTLYIIGENNTDNYPLMIPYVIPEFPSFLILTLFMIATLLAMAIYKRRILTRAL